MTPPKIDSDDAVLFGSLGSFAVGSGLVALAASGDGLLAIGLVLVVFGLPSACIALLAAGSTS